MGAAAGLPARRWPGRADQSGLIAAPARVHGLTIATRNWRDFETCKVDVVNPFDEANA
ncbi:MAG: hypothetical protein ACRD1V_04210 [Vicinamibacterales bacterium]